MTLTSGIVLNKGLGYKLKEPTQANFRKVEFFLEYSWDIQGIQGRVKEPDLRKGGTLGIIAEGIGKY